MLSHGSEGGRRYYAQAHRLYISMLSHGSEGPLQIQIEGKKLYISMLSHGSEGYTTKTADENLL